MMMKI